MKDFSKSKLIASIESLEFATTCTGTMIWMETWYHSVTQTLQLARQLGFQMELLERPAVSSKEK